MPLVVNDNYCWAITAETTIFQFVQPSPKRWGRLDRRDEKIKNSSPVPHLLQAQQAPALPYAKEVGRPGTGSYPTQWRIQRGLGGFKRTPLEPKLFHFHGEFQEKLVKLHKSNPPQLIWTPRSKHPGSAPAAPSPDPTTHGSLTVGMPKILWYCLL